ncbi:CobW family GTP-binding protein [Bacillus alkalisoli]|uniref:CobW family GTP-binding protein n=1 Tax=Bacillus alkalisoli TaxID=2011008 RepID=UPI000C2422CF|nr:GTP-binding protein [Bacillus alkalisoli]
MQKKIDVYILSGFLGSGKTTLLKKMLKSETELGRKVAVIMNELGSVSIDSDQVPKDLPLSELFDGCICCTIQEKLESTVQGLLYEKDLDAIYIETTGAAHPIEVLDTLLSPLFASRLEIAKVVSLLDVTRWNDRHTFSIQIQQLIREQIKHADLIILNKTDLLSEEKVASVLFEIQQINPKAACFLTSFADIPLDSWKTISSIERDKHEALHVKNELNLRTFVYEFKNEIDLDEFEDWLKNLPDTIYRIKGYIKFKNTSSIYLFQYSYGTPLYLKEPIKVPLNLVIIGEELQKDILTSQLKKLEEAGTKLN